MRTEIIYRVWYRDDLRLRLEAGNESGGEAMRVAGEVSPGGTGGAAAVVGNAPVEIREMWYPGLLPLAGMVTDSWYDRRRWE
jgi:hypothetical protein